MARLIGLSGDRKGQVFELTSDLHTLGRGKNSTIPLSDTSVSRTHASVLARDGGFVIRDEGSSYGTFVDGRKVSEQSLFHGNEIRVGQTTLRFEDEGEVRESLPERPPRDDETGLTVMHALGEDVEDEREPRDAASLARVRQRLQTALEVSSLLNGAFALEELFGRLLDQVQAVSKARSAMVLFWNPELKTIDVQASRGAESDRGFGFSHTIVDRVIRSGESLIVNDAGAASDFAPSASIMRLGIRSAMCVPLRHQNLIIGALTAEAPGQGVFEPEDLRLFQLLGNIAGTAIVESRLREEKVKAERMAAIGQSMAGLAHDIKNILSGIKAGGYLVDSALQSNDITTLAAGWDLVKVSQDRIHQLTLNMLDWSKERAPQYEKVDLEQVLTEIKNLIALRGVDQGVGVRVEVEATARYIEAEAVSVHRCVMNLASNALDAMPDGKDGKILLRVRVDESDPTMVNIDVQDNGKGIPEDVLPGLFQAFTSTKGAKGTGLGLAVSHKIAREHRGRITVRSKVGKGTIFTIALPRVKPAANDGSAVTS